MKILRQICVALALCSVALALAGGCEPSAAERSTASVEYGSAFWDHWGDGKAEVAGYDLVFPRYGELRGGTGVAVFVTEEFSESARVKSEAPGRPEADRFPVVKLNWMQDFPTGIYDYNLMTSAFVTTRAVAGLGPGDAVKVAFSAQEWCGQAHATLDFEDGSVRHRLQSYFDGEGDRDERLDRPDGALSEDVLMLWARGLAGPGLNPGERREVKLLRSMEIARLHHVAMDWRLATLERSDGTEQVEVPAGTMSAFRMIVSVGPGTVERLYPPGSGSIEEPARRWTFWVEAASPYRLLRWTRDDGLDARLLGTARVAYWGMNANGYEKALEQIGLQPRPSRTP